MTTKAYSRGDFLGVNMLKPSFFLEILSVRAAPILLELV